MPTPADFDLDFRPESYWDHPDPVSAILSNIKGDLRRAMVRDVLEAEGLRREHYDALLGDLEPGLMDESASGEFVEHVGLMDAQWMGGEYLPDCAPGEVEIARIALASTTRDVMSIRARRCGGRIRYRMVDEYEQPYVLTRKSSVRPLMLRELIHLIDTVDSPSFERNADDSSFIDELRDGVGDDDDIDLAADFVTVRSEVYPELERWYNAQAEEWREREIARRPE